MNANELADYITKNVAQAVHGSATAATMLRTIPALQAEIEALNKTVKRLREDIDLPASDIEEFVLHKYEYFAKCKTIASQQAEMDIVIKLLCGEQISDDLMAYWNPLHSTLKSKLLKAQEK